jgi:hypothetical protein
VRLRRYEIGYSTVDRGGIMSDTRVHARGGRLQMPRSRGAASGFLLILLGAWGALIPFVGPYFDFAFTPDQEWMWTIARGWLEVLPGAATVVGGLLLLGSRNRATAMIGGWLTVLAGAWFVVGRALAGPLGIGDVGTPLAATETKRVWLELTYFYGLGALIVFLGAVALGRLSVRTARDIAHTQRPVAAAAQPQPAPSEEVTEIQPTGEGRHRGWRDMFQGGGRRPAHR